MSWYDDCPLTKDEFEKILLYLHLLRTVRPNLISSNQLDELIRKLSTWLKEE